MVPEVLVTRLVPPLPQTARRHVHGDLKISNLLFRREPLAGVCLVDLDTFAKGSMAFELGDAMRSWCNPLGEDAGTVQTISARYAHGLISLEQAADLGCRACATPGGGCQFLGTAATSQVVGEALGLSLPHTALAPSGQPVATGSLVYHVRLPG